MTLMKEIMKLEEDSTIPNQETRDSPYQFLHFLLQETSMAEILSQLRNVEVCNHEFKKELTSSTIRNCYYLRKP